jgi:hypothetical protein
LMLFWQFCSTFLPLVVAPTAAYTTVLCSKQEHGSSTMHVNVWREHVGGASTEGAIDACRGA